MPLLLHFALDFKFRRKTEIFIYVLKIAGKFSSSDWPIICYSLQKKKLIGQPHLSASRIFLVKQQKAKK